MAWQKRTRDCDTQRRELFKAVAQREAEEKQVAKAHDKMCRKALDIAEKPRTSKWWGRFYKSCVVGKLDMLKARAKKARKHKGESYNRKRALKYPATGPCEVCGGVAHCKHHITPLICGGGNDINNLLDICGFCHAEVHDWIIPEKPDYILAMDKGYSETIK